MSLQQLRKKNGYSQEKLADLSGLSLRTIQRIEKENHGSFESLNAISKVFDLSFDELKNILEDKINSEKEEENTNIKFESFMQFAKNDKHILRFTLIITLIFFINILTNPSYLWFIFPMLGWGIPLFYKRYQKYLALRAK